MPNSRYRAILPGLIAVALMVVVLWQIPGQTALASLQDPQVRISHAAPVRPVEFNGDLRKLPASGSLDKGVLRRQSKLKVLIF